jgi:hypothetical protein
MEPPDKATEFKYGLMVPDMKVSGRMECKMAEESSSMLAEIFMKVSRSDILFKFINY